MLSPNLASALQRDDLTFAGEAVIKQVGILEGQPVPVSVTPRIAFGNAIINIDKTSSYILSGVQTASAVLQQV